MVDKKYRKGLQFLKECQKEKQRKDIIKSIITVLLFYILITPVYIAFMRAYWDYVGLEPLL